VRLERVDGGRPRSIAEMNIGESGQRWLGPAWANGKLFFYRSCFCGRSEGAYRYDPGTRRYAHAPQRLYAGGFAIDDDGRRAFLNAGCNCDDIDALELDNAIRLSAPLHFRPWRSLTPA
jgi:hypothetical protein